MAKPTVKVTKAGDWVLPVVTEDGNTVYALQINKSAEDKQNIDSIRAEYDKAGIPVMEYPGKNSNPVLLVEATKKLKAQRVGLQQEALITGLQKRFKCSREEAMAFLSETKAEAKAAKEAK